jgi:hypothetical protein
MRTALYQTGSGLQAMRNRTRERAARNSHLDNGLGAPACRFSLKSPPERPDTENTEE